MLIESAGGAAARVLGRYDGDGMLSRFADAGVLDALVKRGFGHFAVNLSSPETAPPHIRLSGDKNGIRTVLLDAILNEKVIPREFFTARGHATAHPVELVVVSWLREEDATVAFSPERPALPLQDHPGLGVLRRAFRVVVGLAAELGKDGVASAPKLFHDAVIFYRSRLFLFLDPDEQGRFEALLRDLGDLPIGDASLALAGDCVRDACGELTRWRLSMQVFPVSTVLAGYFNATAYGARVAAVRDAYRFSCDRAALERVRALVTPAGAPG